MKADNCIQPHTSCMFGSYPGAHPCTEPRLTLERLSCQNWNSIKQGMNLSEQIGEVSKYINIHFLRTDNEKWGGEECAITCFVFCIGLARTEYDAPIRNETMNNKSPKKNVTCKAELGVSAVPTYLGGKLINNEKESKDFTLLKNIYTYKAM